MTTLYVEWEPDEVGSPPTAVAADLLGPTDATVSRLNALRT